MITVRDLQNQIEWRMIDAARHAVRETATITQIEEANRVRLGAVAAINQVLLDELIGWRGR